MIVSSKPLRKNYHDNNSKPQPFSSTLKLDPNNLPQSTTNSHFKSTSESPFPRKLHKNSLKPRLMKQSSSKELLNSDKKHSETPLKATRTSSHNMRNSSSLSPSTQLNLKDPARFLNPIEEILPKVNINLKKKKVQKLKSNKNTVVKEKPEKLENGLIFIAKNMKMVEDKMKAKENLKKKEPVFMSQIQTIFKYVLGGGNNCELVKRVLGKRDHWEETTTANTLFNLKWKQDNKGYHYERIIPDSVCRQLLNHFEFHKEISTKSGLVENLAQYCEQNRTELFDLTPITFVLDLDKEDCDINFQSFLQFYMANLPKGLESFKKPIFEIRKKFRNFIPLPAYDKKQSFGNTPYTRPKMKPVYINGTSYLWLLKPTGFNRGRGISIFTTLDQLEKYINEYYEGVVEKSLKQQPLEEKKENEEEITVNNKENNEENKPDISKKLEEIVKKPEDLNNLKKNDEFNKESNKNSEPLKLIDPPNTKKFINNNSTVTNKVKEIKAPVDPNDYIRLSLQNMPNVIKSHTFVIQKYIEKPLLLKGRKFDIRVWCLVTHNMDIYFFKEGYLRTSSEEFNLGDTDNYFIHLTNNAVQKYSSNYGQFENGNQLSFPWFQKYIEENYPGVEFKTNVVNKIKELMYTSMCAVRKKLNPNERKHCFEIFGYDFIVDETLHIWLIEVNTNPCLEESSPLLAMLIPRMLDDAFKLTLDVLFPKRDPPINKSNRPQFQAKPQTNTNIPIPEDKTHSASMNEIKENLFKSNGNDQDIPIEPESTTTNTSNKIEETGIIEKKPAVSFNNKLPKEKPLSQFPVTGYSDEENMWELLGVKMAEKTPMKSSTAKKY